MPRKSSNSFIHKFISSMLVYRRKQPELPIPNVFSFLPPELLEAVASFLNPIDLCALRMTCTVLYQETLPLFGRTFLHCIQTDLSRVSLKRLETISQHPQLRHYACHMTIRGFDEDHSILGEGFEWERHPAGHLVRLQAQSGVKRLREILRQLVNCRSFELYSVSTPDHPDHSNLVRLTDAITIILNIVAEGYISLLSFALNFRAIHNTGRNHLDPRRLNNLTKINNQAGLCTGLSHLEELSLNFSLNFDVVCDFASNLIIYAPNLRKLAIRFDSEDMTSSLIHRLADTPWPRLKELRLKKVMTSADKLTALLCNSQQSLRTLELSLLWIQGSDEELKSLFSALSSSRFPAMNAIKIEPLWAGESQWQRVHFPALSESPIVDKVEGTRFGFASRYWKGTRINCFVDYLGPSMDIALGILADTLELT